MFEVEAANRRLSADRIELVGFSAEYYKSLRAVSLLHWEEHCTECAAPECYRSCSLYEPRKDGKCRRFIDGIVPVDSTPSMQFHPVHVRFKRWGSLMAKGEYRLLSITEVNKLNVKSERFAAIARALPDGRLVVAGRRAPFTRLLHRAKMKLIRAAKEKCSDDLPTHFVCEVFNPQASAASLTLTIRATSGEKNRTPYQKRLVAPNGFTRFKVPFSEVEPYLEIGGSAFHTITPNAEEDESCDGNIALVFGLVGYVAEIATEYSTSARDTSVPASAKSVKVAVWDLDNTLWKGTLVEDGISGVRLDMGIATFITELDQRGIVNSIASKNDDELAKQALEHFGLLDYFVFPRIGWWPKSESVREIIKDFDVGEDAIAFIDDQPFERGEVEASLPLVRTYVPVDVETFRKSPEFNPRQSSESAGRRLFYLKQMERKNAQQGFSGDYHEFLRSCQIVLTISRAKSEDLSRLHELVQRTNQLNFSGTRYSLEQLSALLSDERLDKFKLSCVDRFGSYGTIGLVIVERETATISDMMFSCRVQSKMVEHAFLSWLAGHYDCHPVSMLSVLYTKTERNSPAARVLADIKFSCSKESGNKFTYVRDMRSLREYIAPLSVQWIGD